MDIGSRIRAARKAAGLSQEELARRAGMSLKGMGDIERGDIADPHYSSLSKIAEGLGVPIGELLEEPVPLGRAPQEEAGLSPFEELMLEQRGGATDADLLEEYEKVVHAYRMSWRIALERLAQSWEERLHTGAFDRSMVEQFFTDVADLSQGIAAAISASMEEDSLRRKYKLLPEAVGDTEEMWASAISRAGLYLLVLCDDVYTAAAEKFSSDELEGVRRKQEAVVRTLRRVA